MFDDSRLFAPLVSNPLAEGVAPWNKQTETKLRGAPGTGGIPFHYRIPF